MKKIVVKILGSLLLLAMAAGAASVWIEQRYQAYEDSYKAAAALKLNRLRAIDSPKIVLVGDSTLYYNINSEDIEEAMEMQVVDFGVPDDIDIYWTMDVVKEYLQEGDLVVLSFSYEHYGANRVNIIEKCKKVFSGSNYVLQDDISLYNSFGDYHREMKEKVSFPDVYAVIRPDVISDDFIEYLNNYQEELGSKQVSAVITFPAFVGTNVATLFEEVEDFRIRLEQEGNVKVISDFREYFFAREAFYDSCYNLKTYDRATRTQILIQDLKKYFEADYHPVQHSQKLGIVMLGDSLIGSVRDNTSVSAVVADTIGYSIVNGAFGGTCAASSNEEKSGSRPEDSLSLSYIAKAIAYEDFSVLNSDLTNNRSQMDYFPNALKELSEIDCDNIDILFIEHGVNDYTSGRPLDDAEDPYNICTFGGALRSSIQVLKEAYPDMRIILMTPIYCFIENGEDGYIGDCRTLDYGYGPLENYVNLEIEIAKEMGVEVLDNYRTAGFDENNMRELSYEGLHLNEKGREKLGRHIAEYLLKTLPYAGE